MVKRTEILANEKGFTLIEIIAVLVLLGILAAVAVPKYISLQAEAEQKTIDSVKAELQSRANMYHGQYLLDNTKVDFKKPVTDWDDESVGADFILGSSGGDLTVQPTGSGNVYIVQFQPGTTVPTAKAAIFGTISL